jgi:2-polyprenyl-3-methyl-5-hydroxy-6-metoxy-1,4-benzoquinol methylase
MSELDTAGRSAPKGASYYANERPDVIASLKRPLGRVLDVGCGAGGLARGLRSAGATAIIGVEVQTAAAVEARKVLDEVFALPVEQALPELNGTFDTILCLDVLEHLVDPLDVVSRLRKLASPGGRLQLSVPNARHYSLVRDLVLRGTFGYTDWGHRDNTHLRWFTPRDAVALLEDAGWQVTGTGWPPLTRATLPHRLSRGRLTEFLVAQVYVSARNSV